MLLRIIDNLAVGNGQDAIRIVFESNSKTDSFVTESYTSPISNSFRNSLAQYFKDYPLGLVNDVDASGVIEKLIKFGQYIGDELLGEDHQLIKLKENIEKLGYENLQVQIESARIEFFKELWETTILPESKYVLSAVVKSYVRQFVQADFQHDYPELCYNLKVNPPVQDKVTKLLQGDNLKAHKPNPENHNPLNILYLVSRPATFELPFSSSNSINLSLQAVAAGGAIDYEVQHAIDWNQLQNKLINKNKPIHILHYDGPVILENDDASIVLTNSVGESSLININNLSSILAANKVGALFVDARVYLQHNTPISAVEGLAMIARSAHQYGLGNIVGLDQITAPWISSQCFETIYSKIAKGLDLGQAVVEARKALQSSTETSLTTVTPITFHPWSLLVHYSKQSVTFFDSPHIFADPDDSAGLESFQNKLFGFRSEMLPPRLNQVSDGQVVMLIDQLMAAQQSGAKQAVSIIGEPGSGKSQLAHVVSLCCAQKQQIDYGFYFNFSNDYYSPDDMLEMIAPILELDVNQLGEVKEKLTHLHCCFVLDGTDSIYQQANENEEHELNQFLQLLLTNGHIVILAGNSYSALHELALIKIETNPLSLIEQKILAVNVLRQHQLLEVNQNEEWERLLTSLNGHPWLTKKLMPLLRSRDANELTSLVNQYINFAQNTSKIEQFYEWQWAELKPVWQQLLILCSDVRGLLLEMLMTAFDQKEPFLPAKSLCQLLGEKDLHFSEGLALWEASGFLTRVSHGLIVDSRCLNFLASKREAGFFDGIDQQKLRFHFSQLICEGIRLSAEYIINRPNPAIFNNLLMNRRYWVKHFENLWFGQDYRGFFAVKNAFDQLLQQAKLVNESSIWSLNLLERSPMVLVTDDVSIEAKLSWLALALTALGNSEAKDNAYLLEGANVWRVWFDQLNDSIDRHQLVLFQQATKFLEIVYQGKSNWVDAIIVCEKSYAIYMRYEAWQKVIQSLKSLTKYHWELGQKDRAWLFENKIITDIPYDTAPPGFQTQQMLDILLVRLARTDTEQAQILLNQLRETADTDKLVDMLDGIQCDLDYQNENYLASLPHYCKIWVRSLQSGLPAQLEQLQSRLKVLEQKIGGEKFNEYFEREVPVGTIKPKDYVSHLH